VAFGDALTIAIAAVQETRAAAEQELFVDSAELVLPKPVEIEDVRRQELRGHTAGKILQTLPNPAARERCVVAVCFGVRLLDQRDPRLVLILTLGEEEGLGAGLVGLAIDTLDILAVDLLQQITLHAGRVPTW
jgi:hypothetical protein